MKKHMLISDKAVAAKIDSIFDKELESVSIARIKNDLESELIPKREVTRMITNTEYWKKVKEELISKPRKK